MLLLDYSQIAVSNLHTQLKGTGDLLEPDLLRHMILNSIRRVNREFGNKYGQIVICADSSRYNGSTYWRKEFYRHYKANRKKVRDGLDIDWGMFFQTLDQLRTELHENFPYKVLHIPRAEADDIIGVITKNFHSRESVLIISGDKDFLQLQKYDNVQQYSLVKNEYLTTSNPVECLQEHIIRGDVGDGVPNYLSPDDVFVTGGRQKPIMAVKAALWVKQQPEEYCTEITLKHYHRNKMLVDLDMIPTDIQEQILAEFATPIVGKHSKIYPYLVRHKMKNLLDLMREF